MNVEKIWYLVHFSRFQHGRQRLFFHGKPLFCNLVKDKIESVCFTLTNSVGTCDAEEALNDIDLIVGVVSCFDSVVRVPEDVYQDILTARRMIENSSQASMRTPSIKTSI